MNDLEGSASSLARPFKRPPTIVFLLFSIALLTLVPALVFSAILLQRNDQAQREIVRTLTLATAHAINSSIDREVGGMITTLKVLSTSSDLEEGNLQRFYHRTKAALEDSDSFLLVLDGSMQQVINTRVPFGTELPKTSDPESALEVMKSGKVKVSDVFFGAVSHQLVFNVLLPRKTETGQDQVLLLTQNANNLAKALSRAPPPEGWHAALLDSKFAVATSTAGLEPGKSFFLRIDVTDQYAANWVRAKADGIDYDMIVSRSPLTGWYTVVWAPVGVVSEPMMESVRWLILGGALITAIVIGAVAWVAGQIARSVRSLAADARMLGLGEPVTAKNYPVRELADISGKLVEAAQSRQQKETEIRFLMRELAHRAKNQLAVIQAMAKQTANSTEDVGSFLENFQKRILGLARSTDLLLSDGANGVSLSDLADAQLQAFRADGRVEIKGPMVRLNSEASQSLGMALHEMATNAAKYGAFSDDDGALEIGWQWQDQVLVLTWRESNVRLEPRGERKGFGSTVIEKLVAASLNAGVEKTMHPDGIEWVLRMPRERILTESGAKTSI